MVRHCNRFAVLLAPLTLLVLAGCGGSGSGSSSTGGNASLDVFVTDGFGDQYRQVLLTLYQIDLFDGTNWTTVFTDSGGQTINLSSMASTAQLLASLNVPAGNYTQARVTFGDHVTLVSNSGVSTSVAVDPSIGTQSGGKVTVTIQTPTRINPGTPAAIFIDFKLAEFTLTGGLLRPHVEAGDTGEDEAKACTVHVKGTVANLAQDGSSFTLQGQGNRTITVNVTGTTTVTSGQTGSAVTLANGQSVIVMGTFDRTTRTITATSIILNDFTTIHHAEASGTVASVNATDGSFVLTVQHADDIQPTGGTITVQTNADTVFLKHMHMRQQGSFSDIAVNGAVEVGGVFDTTTQTLTAKVVRLGEDH